MSVERENNILILPDGRRLGYAEYGDPEGWPLMFFHGTPGSRVMARFAAPKAREMGVRLIAPERPGFGLSDFKPQRQLLDWAEDVRELAEVLNLERFAVAGVSGGGPYVAACAWKMPARLSRRRDHQRFGPVGPPPGEIGVEFTSSVERRAGASGWAGQPGAGFAGPERPAVSRADHQKHVPGGALSG